MNGFKKATVSQMRKKNLNELCRTKFQIFFHLLVVRRYRVYVSKRVKMEKNEDEESDKVEKQFKVFNIIFFWKKGRV